MSNNKPPKKTVPHIPREPSVRISDYLYLVEMDGAFHSVGKNKKCLQHGGECKAINIVAQYLKDGGERVEECPVDYWPYLPEICPICGAAVESDPALFSKSHGAGWRCSLTGRNHYFEALAQPIKPLMSKREWLIAPAGSYPGVSRIEFFALRDEKLKAGEWDYLIQDY